MKEPVYPQSLKTASLSVVIPVHNAADWILRTLEHLDAALKNTGWAKAEVIIVDDGSSDGTTDALNHLESHSGLCVLRHPNQGRFLSRRRGLLAASGAYILFLDARVFLHPDSLSFIEKQIQEHPERTVWNGYVVPFKEGNVYARFWDALTRIAWRKYLIQPRLTSYDFETFDLYPKGTSCFFAPRALLIDAYDHFTTLYDDLRLVSDDTQLIRYIAGRLPIHIGPEFSCTYHARDSFVEFLRQAFYRGTTFVDGFLRRGTRFFVPLIGFLVVSPLGIAALFRWPRAMLMLALALSLLELAMSVGLRVGLKDSVALALLSPAFALAYGAGIWRGMFMALKRRFSRQRP